MNTASSKFDQVLKLFRSINQLMVYILTSCGLKSSLKIRTFRFFSSFEMFTSQQPRGITTQMVRFLVSLPLISALCSLR